MNLTTDLHYFFFNISCNNTGSLVVMKSTPWLMSHSISLASFTEYITFSRHATKEFIRLAPKGTPVYYLEGDLNPLALSRYC